MRVGDAKRRVHPTPLLAWCASPGVDTDPPSALDTWASQDSGLEGVKRRVKTLRIARLRSNALYDPRAFCTLSRTKFGVLTLRAPTPPGFQPQPIWPAAHRLSGTCNPQKPLRIPRTSVASFGGRQRGQPTDHPWRRVSPSHVCPSLRMPPSRDSRIRPTTGLPPHPLPLGDCLGDLGGAL